MLSDFNMKKQPKNISVMWSCLPCSKLLLFAAMLFISVIVKAQETTLVAVGNSSSVPSDMKLSELKAILLGEKQRWKNGSRIIIALMKTNTMIGKNTSSRMYDMTGDQLNKYWLALVFQGKAQAPNFFSSTNDLENFVAQTQGAIGIVDKPIIDGELRGVLVNGQKTF